MNAPPDMRRLIRAVGILFAGTAAATMLWWAAHERAAAASIATAKWLHRLIGFPAPYLIADAVDRWWFAPPGQLLVGLVLASWWRTWRGRLVDLAFCLALYWFVSAMTIALTCSPYIGPMRVRDLTGIVLTKSLLVVVPVILWGVTVGWAGWHDAREGAPGKKEPRREKRKQDRQGRGVSRQRCAGLLRYPAATGICLLLPMACWAMSAAAPQGVREARAQAAAALRAGDSRQAAAAVMNLGRVEVRQTGHNLPLYYLAANLLQEIGEFDAAIRVIDPVRFETPFNDLLVQLKAQAAARRETAAKK